MQARTTRLILDLCVLFLLLWTQIGLWACAHKILEIEQRMKDKETAVSVESDSSKIMMCAMRIHKLEQENDMLRMKLDDVDLAMFLMTNKPAIHIKQDIPGAVDDLIQ